MIVSCSKIKVGDIVVYDNNSYSHPAAICIVTKIRVRKRNHLTRVKVYVISLGVKWFDMFNDFDFSSNVYFYKLSDRIFKI